MRGNSSACRFFAQGRCRNQQGFGATAFTTACVAIEAGVMLGLFYALTGRLWVSIGVHAGWNFTQGTVFGAAVLWTAWRHHRFAKAIS